METANNIREEEQEIDLRELFFVLLGRIWSIILCVVAGVIIAAAVTSLMLTPMYSSTSIFFIKSSGDISSISLSALQTSSALVDDYQLLVKSRPVLNKVIEELELDMEYEELAGMVSVENPTGTHFITITVEHADPYMAKFIVDEVTQVAVDRTVEIMETTIPQIVEEGTVNETPISPSMKKNVAIGGGIGLVLAVLVITAMYLLNDTVRTSEDIEKYLGLDTLGTIPMEEGMTRRAAKKREKQQHKKHVAAKKKAVGRRHAS